MQRRCPAAGGPSAAHTRSARSLLGGLLLLAVAALAGACATPVGVTPVDPQSANHLLTANVVSAGQPSEFTLRVLRRFGLQERFEKEPAEALSALHQTFVSRGGVDRLVALA